MSYNITIVGTGNAACAHAAMFALDGHRVTLFKTSNQGNLSNFTQLRRNKQIRVIDLDQVEHSVNIFNVTDDGADAFNCCDICFVMVQTLYHERVAKILGRHLKSAKLLFVVPGYMGSLYFQKEVGGRVPIIAEGESTAFDARIIVDGLVKILFKNVRNAIGVLQGRKDEALTIMSALVDTYKYTRRNIVDSALHNPNLIVHTIGAIMSASRIEYSHGNFWMYKEAFTPSIWNLVKKLDEEKMQILKCAGCDPIPYLEACKFRNCEDQSIDALEVFNSYAEEGGPKGPLTVRTRYIMEDVPMGLCLMSSLGRKYGVACPTCDSLIYIAETLVGENFWSQGRTIDRLPIYKF